MRVAMRLFFVLVGFIGVAGLVAGGGCTKRGHMLPSPTPPSAITIYVNPLTGSDTTGNGSSPKPYRTLTKAVSVVPTSAQFEGTDTINLAAGHYSKATGEVYPIAIPTGLTIAGSNYGSGSANGTYIDGYGEDTSYENLVGAPKGTYYATLVVDTPTTLNLSNVYVGVSALGLSSSTAAYASIDVLGTLSGTDATFGVGKTNHQEFGGIAAPSGTFSCATCVIFGNAYAIVARSIPNATAPPSVTLTGSTKNGFVVGKGTAILTDGTATLVVSGQIFQSPSQHAYADTIKPLVTTAAASIDFGSSSAGCGSGSQTTQGSPGNNTIAGVPSTSSEIYITVPGAIVCGYGDVWNQNAQGSSPTGTYTAPQTFAPGTVGQNVTVLKSATGSSVTVGPYVAPTPSPSPTPSGSPSGTPTPSPTPT